MQFRDIMNEKQHKVPERALMQKDAFPVSSRLEQYLKENGRDLVLPLSYNDLLYYSHADAERDRMGKLTHWETAKYDEKVRRQLYASLIKTYTILRRQPDPGYARQLSIARIDFCEFGNSIPFRISILHNDQGRRDLFYVKQADASRIYGLELEQLLSPDTTNFLCHHTTLVEEHIDGVAGDVFIKDAGLNDRYAPVLAKEFVQFNERCFARLLGDMRSYNFVVQTNATSNHPYRIRAIDFDQQSYEGNKNLYLPQFFNENFLYADLVLQNLSNEKILHYQSTERSRMRERVIANKKRLMHLLTAMNKDELSENYKIVLLRKELNEHFQTTAYSHCKTMGAIVKRQLKQMLL